MKLVDSILKKSEHPAFFWVVFFMTFCESIFLFIPPEVFIAPSIVANKKRVLPITIAAALGSLVGGAVAYMIGLWLFDSVGVWLINNFSSMTEFAIAQQMFVKHGILIMLITAFTPVPYKMVSICAGFIGFPVFLFLLISAIFRTSRFALVAYLLWRYQEKANKIVKKYFWHLIIFAVIFAASGIGILFLI